MIFYIIIYMISFDNFYSRGRKPSYNSNNNNNNSNINNINETQPVLQKPIDYPFDNMKREFEYILKDKNEQYVVMIESEFEKNIQNARNDEDYYYMHDLHQFKKYIIKFNGNMKQFIKRLRSFKKTKNINELWMYYNHKDILLIDFVVGFYEYNKNLKNVILYLVSNGANIINLKYFINQETLREVYPILINGLYRWNKKQKNKTNNKTKNKNYKNIYNNVKKTVNYSVGKNIENKLSRKLNNNVKWKILNF